MDLRDYDRQRTCDTMYPGPPRDPAQDAALHTPALMDPQEVQPPLAYSRAQEMLIYSGTISGHVAWDHMEPSDIAAAAWYRQVALGKTYYGYAYTPINDTPENIAAQVQAQSFIVERFAPVDTSGFGGVQ